MAQQPASQGRQAMARKRKVVRQLLDRGLSTGQIAAQVTCSTGFVRKVRREVATEHFSRDDTGLDRRSGQERRSGRDRRSRVVAGRDRRSGRDRSGEDAQLLVS